jgi:hypothetical protein
MNEHDQVQLGFTAVVTLIWLVCVIVCFLKWKTWTAIFGIIAPILSEIPIGGMYLHRIITEPFIYVGLPAAAIRLAHPGSWWARWRYKNNPDKILRSLARYKKTPEEKERMMDSRKIARFETFKRVDQNLPEQLPNRDEIARAIAEQINYATASSQFEGDDEEMRRKLKALFDELLRNGADEAANEIAKAVDMRRHYLALAESIMR